ncbi:MAG TPA: RDD family protein [Schlesneria sp.]
MSHRKPRYLLILFVLVVFCSAPHLVILFKLASDAVAMRRLPFQLNQSWGQVVQRGGMMSHSTFARGRFRYLNYRERVNGQYQWTLTTIDPRTRTEDVMPFQIPSAAFLQVLRFGSRLWIVGNSEAYEVVGDEARPSSMINPTPWVAEPQRFLLDGEPAVIVKSGTRFTISTFETGVWAVSHNLLLPDRPGETIVDGVPINFSKAGNATIVNQGDRIHLYLEVDGWLLYREGLDLQSVTGSAIRTAGLPEESASALRMLKTNEASATWSLINKAAIADVGVNFAPRYRMTGNKFGLLVDGQPAALLVDGSDPGTMIGHLFRFDGRVWTEFDTQTFPFGTAAIRVAFDQDGQDSFIVARTSTGVVNAYEVDASGVLATPGNEVVTAQAFVASHAVVDAAGMLTFALMLAAVLGVGVSLAMHHYTQPDYRFGAQHGRLAGLGRRGLARTIDLGLIGLSTATLTVLLTWNLDWLSLMEALNLQLPHPTVVAAERTVWIMMLWLVTCEMILVICQARWGLTIGKWCCGLRTRQTTLKPCGFTRSLVRELVFFIDVCCFLCWTPGIISIALTDRRQRLGDIVADTLVVEASSMKS